MEIGDISEEGTFSVRIKGFCCLAYQDTKIIFDGDFDSDHVEKYPPISTELKPEEIQQMINDLELNDEDHFSYVFENVDLTII